MKIIGLGPPNLEQVGKIILVGPCHPTPNIKMNPRSWYQDLKILLPRSWYQDRGTKILVPKSWYQDPGTKILVPRSWYQDFERTSIKYFPEPITERTSIKIVMKMGARTPNCRTFLLFRGVF